MFCRLNHCQADDWSCDQVSIRAGAGVVERGDEYNGFNSGPIIFTCPEHCGCRAAIRNHCQPGDHGSCLLVLRKAGNKKLPMSTANDATPRKFRRRLGCGMGCGPQKWRWRIALGFAPRTCGAPWLED